MSKKKTKFIAYFLIFIFSILLLFLRSDLFIPAKFTVVNAISLPMRILSFPFRELKKILFYHRTFDEYLRLRKEVNGLKARLVGFEEVLLENNRLEKILDLKRSLLFPSVAASVIGRDPSKWNAVMIIDKGKQDGVDLGMPVIEALGVVGKVAEVSDRRSKVILISDPSFSVAAVIQRSREVGLVSGTLQGLSRLRYLPADADVQVGDQIVSSQLSSSFPEGLLIGEVIAVDKNANSDMIDCIVQPAASLSQIEEVLVVLKK